MDAKKLEKLLHYADRPLTEFLQYDVFMHDQVGDDLMRPDQDGDWMASGEVEELMYGSTVRILIKSGTRQDDVLRALKKVRKWIKRDGLYNARPFRNRPPKEDFLEFLEKHPTSTALPPPSEYPPDWEKK